MAQLLNTLLGKPEKVDPNATRYAGLNIRMLANLVDMLILMLLTAPLMLFRPAQVDLPQNTPQEVVQAMQMHNSGQITDDQFTQMMLQSGYLQNDIIPKILFYSSMNILVLAVLYIVCWKIWASTPGKIVFGLKIVDEKTLKDPSTAQCFLRFLGYIVAMIPLFIGFLMIPFNKKKKGLHDMMAGTVVIYSRPYNATLEEKKKKWRIYIMVILLIIGAIYLSNKL